MVPAPWSRRILAWCLDVALAAALGAVLLVLAGGTGWLAGVARLLTFKAVDARALGPLAPTRLSAARNSDPVALAALGRAILALVTILAAWLGYKIVAVTRWGATLGKRVCGLEVAALAEDGTLSPGHPSRAAATRRVFVPTGLAAIPIPGIGLVGYFAAWTHAQRRGLHDLAAGTVVIPRRATPAPR